MPMNDAVSMPPNTGVPTSRRANCDGPTAMTSGSSPRMKAKDVIITGRKRSLRAFGRSLQQRDALGTALLGELHDQDAVLRRQPDQHHHADLRIEIERETRERRMAAKDPTTPIVTDSRTGTGMVQLSYSATRNR